MMLLSTMVRFAARRVKVNIAQQTKPQNQDKTKFSEDEILQMAGFKQGARSTLKVFREKVNERVKNKIKQQRQKQKQENEQEEEESQDYDDTASYEKKMKKPKSYFERFRSPHLDQQQRITPQQISLKQLSRIRLQPQYLPMHFMQRVKKVFHKYSQQQLREIAQHFGYYTKLRYSEEKIDYEAYHDLGFQKLQYKPQKVGGQNQQKPIYLTGKSKIYELPSGQEQTAKKRKVDEDPLANDITYTQNVVVSYLLLRVPKTYAVATRLLTEIKYKFDNFKPQTFIDFGAGLGSGALAYLDTFQKRDSDDHQVYSVQPAPKMRKMSQYLIPQKVQHFKSLGQLSLKVKQVDIVYAGYVLNELDPQLVEIYLESLWAKVKNQGFLVLVEHGNPFGARIIHQARKWILNKTDSQIAAPCPHHMRCPLARSKQWCHFDQPVGMYPKEVFGHLPNDNQVKLQKFSYLIIQKISKNQNEQEIQPNVTNQWDRVVFPLMKRGGHFVMNLCTRKGTWERRIIAKSHGEEYKEGRKLKWGDLWRFGKRIPNKFRKQRQTGKRLW